jgi:hypothetical protein
MTTNSNEVPEKQFPETELNSDHPISIDNPTPSKALQVDNEEKEQEYITGFKLYSVLLGLMLVIFLIMLDQTILVTAIPRISTEFNSIKDIGWYGSAYLLTA